MPNRTSRSALAATLGLALAGMAGPAWASGFAIFEQGARGMGFAGAYAAQTDDPSAIFHNAAGLAFLKGNQLYFGATLIAPKSDFNGAAPYPGSTVTEKGDAGLIVPPAFDLSHQVSGRLVVGFGVHVPYGLRTRWANRDTTYTGRFISKTASLQSLSFNPTVAYKLADRLAIGGGVDIRLSSLELDRNVPVIDPFTNTVKDAAAVVLKSNHALGWGFDVGVLAKPIENLSVGVSYRHKIKTDFSGSGDFQLLSTGNAQLDAAVALRVPSGSVPVSTSIEFPSIVELGANYKWNDWILAADVDFQQWSSFSSLPINFENRPDLSSVVEENYKNSRIYRVGLERRVNDSWDVRGGYYFDQNPEPAESVSPLLPDADRHCAAFGATFRHGRFHVDVADWVLFFKQRSTEGVNRDNYNGTYKNSANLFAVSLGLSF
jgi:long-chain fatty acid transport protein